MACFLESSQAWAALVLALELTLHQTDKTIVTSWALYLGNLFARLCSASWLHHTEGHKSQGKPAWSRNHGSLLHDAAALHRHGGAVVIGLWMLMRSALPLESTVRSRWISTTMFLKFTCISQCFNWHQRPPLPWRQARKGKKKDVFKIPVCNTLSKKMWQQTIWMTIWLCPIS